MHQSTTRKSCRLAKLCTHAIRCDSQQQPHNLSLPSRQNPRAQALRRDAQGGSARLALQRAAQQSWQQDSHNGGCHIRKQSTETFSSASRDMCSYAFDAGLIMRHKGSAKATPTPEKAQALLATTYCCQPTYGSLKCPLWRLIQHTSTRKP